MRHFNAAVVSNRPLAENTWEMEFGWEGDGAPSPGQFFSILAFDSTDPLLRRPFAFSRFDAASSRASFIFLKRGKATAALSSLAPGARIDIVGPLGKGFPPHPGGDEPAVLVAGGIGLGPLLCLADSFAAACLPFAFIYGARNASLVPGARLPRGAIVMTDDGSAGERGTAADALVPLIASGVSRVYACGPGPMLKAAARISAEAGVPCSVSMEQHMACGVGACMGCAVKLSGGGYARACAEGPVFEASAIAWED